MPTATSRLAAPAAWTALTAALVFVSLAPLTVDTQLQWSLPLLAALFATYLLGRRATSRRAQSVARLTVLAITGFLSLRYIQWRATESLPLQFGLAAMVGGLLLFLAELYAFVNLVFGFVVNAEPLERTPRPLPPEDALPHVDVYIPTYNEDPAIVRPTVIAATQMRYPRHKLHVWLLDDGGTDQKLADPDPARAAAARERAQALRDIASRYGAGYLTRARNLHAKAGNLNSALGHTRGDLLLVLDCDHIPVADFLERTVGFFAEDPSLFVLQTPHNFVSPDPVERNLDLHKHSPSENELFYDVMQPGLDLWGSSFFCGSAAILRRSVVDRLGGISGRTITEDAETTLDAMSLGYTSAYYRRAMVSGLQPETFSGFITQRARWGQGMWQIFLLKNPWRQPRISLMQRLLYTNFAFYWGFAFARVVMLLAPPVYLLFDVNLCDTTPAQLAAYAAPALVASLVSTQFVYGRVRWPYMSQLYEIVQSVYVLRALGEVVRQPAAPQFKVTPKGEVLTQDFVSSLARPFYALLAFTVAGIAWAVHRWPQEPQHHGVIGFVAFWAVMDMFLLLGALGITMERRQLRAEPRALHEEPVRVHQDGRAWDGATTDASASGLGMRLALAGGGSGGPAPGRDLRIEFPARGRSIGGRLLSSRRVEGGVAAGIRYELSAVEDERLAVDVAFGDSEALEAANRRRHTGRGYGRGTLMLVGFALRQGLDHLLHLLRQARPPRPPAPPRDDDWASTLPALESDFVPLTSLPTPTASLRAR